MNDGNPNTAFKATETAALCVGRAEIAAMLGVSQRTARRLDDGGKLPEALKLGGTKRWYRPEIEEWLRAGAPPRRHWAAMRKSAT